MKKTKNINNIYNKIKSISLFSKEKIKSELPVLFEYFKNPEINEYYISEIFISNFLEENDFTLVPYFKSILNTDNKIAHKKALNFLYNIDKHFLYEIRMDLEKLNIKYSKENDFNYWFSPRRLIDTIEKNLPRDSFDFDAVEYLSKKPKEELKEIIPDLAFWLDDSNSPIYGDIAKLLSNFQIELIPEFIKVIEKNDYTAKSNWLMFMCHFPNKNVIIKIKNILERFAKNPTKEEIEEDINIYALELLEKIK